MITTIAHVLSGLIGAGIILIGVRYLLAPKAAAYGIHGATAAVRLVISALLTAA